MAERNGSPTFSWVVRLLLVQLHLLVGCSQGDDSFCSRSFAPPACPRPPTFDSIDISAYSGLWYEIGTTARFKLGVQGSTCITANYTLIKAASSDEGAEISLHNTGVQVVGALARAGISQINSATVGACSAARSVCQQLGPMGDIAAALSQVSAVGESLSEAEAAELHKAGSEIEAAVSGMVVGMNLLESKLQQIQVRDAKLLQAAGKKETQLHRLSSILSQATHQASALEKLIYTLDHPCSQITAAATSLLSSNPFAASQLASSVVKMLAEKKKLLQRVADMVLEIAAMAEAASNLIAVDDSRRREAVVGMAVGVQNGTSPGKLTVRFTGSPAQGSYWILTATGQARTGYDAALVYSCSETSPAALTEDLFVLSRAPTLPVDVIDSFLTLAKTYGFHFSCEDPFVLGLQATPWCG